MKFMNQKGVMHLLPILVLTILITGVVVAVQSTSNRSNSQDVRSQAATFDPVTRIFSETFDGLPTTPQPLGGIAGKTLLPDWDIQVHSRDSGTWDNLENQNNVMHGADCAAPPATHSNNTYEGAVFNCKNHIMTAMTAEGYGLIALTPNAMVDLSNGPGVVQWEMSTHRMSQRDWPDIWISPFLEQNALPFDQGDVDLQNWPKTALHFDLANAQNAWVVKRVSNSQISQLNDVYNTPPMHQGIPNDVNQDAVRQTFRATITRTHLKLERLASTTGTAVVYFDKDIPDLGFSQGVVQFTHHIYNPTKDNSGVPATWHWDNISINPAVRFTMIRADKRRLSSPGSVMFDRPAPANSYLRFSGIGAVQYSVTNGATWQTANKQYFVGHFEHMSPYFISIPQGTQKVDFRFAADDWYHCGFGCQAKDFAIWSQTVQNGVSPAPTSTPVPTVVPTASPTPLGTVVPAATPTPTLRPTNTPTPRPTNTPTPRPTNTPIPTSVATNTPTPIVVATSTPQPASGWMAAYYSWSGSDGSRGLNGSPLQTTVLGGSLDLNWRWGSPSSGVPRNNFSARFTKQETFAGGTYRFTIRNDDGVRVYVDGQLITSDATYWQDQAASTRTLQTSITPGAHTVRVEYYENRGRAQVAVSWIRL